jgi:hypothetical protein
VDPITQPDDQPTSTDEVDAPDTAPRIAWAGGRRTVASLLAEIGLQGQAPVLVVAGAAATMDRSILPRLRPLLERGALRAANDAHAVVVDGGTASGVMAVLGEALAASDQEATLVGVAPAGKVTFAGDVRAQHGDTGLEPNHTHFVLANSNEWGGETTLLFDVVEAIRSARPAPAPPPRAIRTFADALVAPKLPAARRAPGFPERPAVMLVVGGGPGTLAEVSTASHRGMPVVVLAGTGGFADELAVGADPAMRSSAPPAVVALVDSTQVQVMPIETAPEDLRQVLAGLLGEDRTLEHAWRQHAAVSRTSARRQLSYRDRAKLILGLGVLVTFLVAVQVVLERDGWLAVYPQLGNLLHLLIVAIPITVGIFTAAMTAFRPGPQWIVLRGTSESIKSEIYRYRARAGKYSFAETRTTPASTKLARAIGSTMGSLMRTDVNTDALETVRSDPVSKSLVAGDDGRSPLTPDDYLRFRVDDQIRFYREKTRTRARDLRTLGWLILGFGGLGTLLAAFEYEIWVAVTVAVVGAFATYLEATQLQQTVILYNQAATDLDSIRSWWLALPPLEKRTQANVNRLVERSEEIMRAEHSGWVQSMQDAMTKLRLDAADAKRDADPLAGEPGPQTTQVDTSAPSARAGEAGKDSATRPNARGKATVRKAAGTKGDTTSRNGSGNGTGRTPTSVPAGADAPPTEAGGSKGDAPGPT